MVFAGTVNDADIPEDQLQVEWYSDKDGFLGSSLPSSSGEVSFAFSDLSADTHNITMVVIDELDARCNASILYTASTPPTLVINTPLAGEIISEGSPVSFDITVSDAEDQPDEVYLEWQLNGQPYSNLSATSTGTAYLSDSTLSFGDYTLTVIATDQSGSTTSEQVSFQVNGLPTTPTVSIYPSFAMTMDDLSVNITNPSIDPEGNSVSYSYQWFKNNIIQPGYTTETLPSLLQQRRRMDCTGDCLIPSRQALLQKPPEQFKTLLLCPTESFEQFFRVPVEQEDDLYCELDPIPTDADGDTIYYTFDWIDPTGNLIGSGGTPTTTPFDVLSALTPTTEGTWSCLVSINDGTDSGGSASAIIDVATGCVLGEYDCPGLSCQDILENVFDW